MIHPGDPREGNKEPLNKKLSDPKKNDKINKCKTYPKGWEVSSQANPLCS
jgi:hypothetical protein